MILAIRHGITSNTKIYKCEKIKNETLHVKVLSISNNYFFFIEYRMRTE